MSAQSLTIVALDNPLPANYGGALELANKLRALQAIGCEVELHAYARPNRQSVLPALGELCSAVHMYPRVERVWALASAVPYTVSTRNSGQLLKRLVAGQGPVLFDGLHTTALVPALARQAPHRPLFLRLHNIESVYYDELAASASNPVAVAYYKTQTFKLRHWEAYCYPYFQAVFPIAQHEAAAVAAVCPAGTQVEWVPAFVGETSTPPVGGSDSETGSFRVLYHGDFSVPGNRQAVRSLVEVWHRSVPRHAPYRLVLAGRSADQLARWALPRHTEVYANPADMVAVARLCQAVLLPGTQRSGAKFKFLNTVAWGIPHLASHATVLGTGLETCTPLLDVSGNLYHQLSEFFAGAHTHTFAEQRRRFEALYNPVVVAHQLVKACHA
jgi:hypothetical protein